ncbi:MAG: PAS domain S-box protein, partial [Burkholderiaceae bacterium]
IAVVGLAEPEAYAGYAHRRNLYLWWAGCTSAAILAFIALLLRQSRRLQNSMRAAREAQDTYHAVVEGGLDAFYILKAQRDDSGAITDFTFVTANRRAAQLFGLPLAQLLAGRSLRQVPPFPGRDGFFEKCVEVTVSRQLLEEESETEAADGTMQWWQHLWIPIDGGVAVTSRDITGRKRIETESRHSNNFLQSLIHYLPTLIYVKNLPPDRPGEMIVWNKAAEEVTGYRAGEVIGKTLEQIFPPERARSLQQLSDQMRIAPCVIDLPEYPFRRPDGSEVFLRTISLPLADEHGKPEYLLGIAVDITERRARELELRTRQAELAAANDSSPLGVFRTDADGRCTYVNRAYEQMSGLPAARALGAGWVEAVHPQDRLKVFQGWSKTARQRVPYQGTYRFLHADGRIVWASVKSAPIVVDGQLLGHVGSVDDITARRAAEKALQESEQHLRTIADTLPALVAFVDTEQRFRFNNLAYERVFGIARDAIRGMSMRELVGEALYQRALPWIERALGGETVTFEIDEHRNGEYRCSEATYTPEFDADEPSRVIGFHVMAHDVTAKKIHERRLVEMTRIDSLTGLLNRAGFEAKLEQAMANSRHEKTLMAVIYLDVDHFKRINDTYGHPIGDALLKSFVARLLRTLRATDSVARLGGDEFTVIMEDLKQPQDAAAIAAKIGQAMRPPFSLEGQTVQVSASLGLAYYRGGSETREQLLKQADDMLYEAKKAGRDTYRIAPPPAA